MGRFDFQCTRVRPIHPMLVAFPIAFLVGTLATDLVFWRDADHFWTLASE
jgi:uncharacterized membrane protein